MPNFQILSKTAVKVTPKVVASTQDKYIRLATPTLLTRTKLGSLEVPHVLPNCPEVIWAILKQH